MRVKVRVCQILRSLYLLRLDDDETRFFEAVWPIPEGVTYNSYLLLTDEGAVLFDTWKHSYADLFVEKLEELVDPTDIKYIVIHHVEKDHSGALPQVMERNKGKAVVLGHPLARSMLEHFYGISPEFKTVGDGDEVSIGGRTVKFIRTPWLHWPETLMSYLDGVLLSGDAFGGFSIPPLFDEEEKAVSEYLRYVRKYIVTIVGHYSDYILKAVDKLSSSGLPVKVVAPAHGMVFREKPATIINYYVKVARKEAEKGKVLVVYASMYGAVEEAVSVAIEALRERGADPVVYKITDKESFSLGEALSDAVDSEAIVIGAPTYEADVFPPMKYFLELLTAKVKGGKPVVVVSSYGWGGVAGKKMAKALEGAGFNVVGVIEFRGQPGGEDLANLWRTIAEMLAL